MTTALENKRFKFIVASAEEAVRVLREKLGEHAKVISVRQVESGGLARFLHAPKLEIVAEVVPPDPPPEPEPSTPEPEPAPTAEVELPSPSEKPEVLAAEKFARILGCAGITEPLRARLKEEPEWPGIERVRAFNPAAL